MFSTYQCKQLKLLVHAYASNSARGSNINLSLVVVGPPGIICTTRYLNEKLSYMLEVNIFFFKILFN